MTRASELAARVALLAMLAVGCSSTDTGGAVSGGQTTSAAPVDIAVVVSVTGAASGERSGSVTCQGAAAHGTGFFLEPDSATAACTALLGVQGLQNRLLHGPSANQACTQQDGGTAKARITGTVHGTSVDASFSRKDGCEIEDWQQFVVLLGAG